MKLVITGGGTGGHIFAGVAIAEEFVHRSKANDVLFIGSKSGLETRLVPKAGFRLETLKLGRLVGQGLLVRVLTLWQIPWAVLKSMRLLHAFKADMVVGVGGFAAGPCIVAAKALGIPCGVLEQNSVMGLTNRIAATLAGTVFVTYAEPPAGVPAGKCVVTGNPARGNLKPSAQPKPSRPFTIFAFGGSQGAHGINRLLTEAARDLLPLKDQLRIIHQTGERECEKVKKAYEEVGFPAEVHAFIDDMQTMYDRASLVVCRAGASTISELGATRNAALFIPFPFAAANHQETNARAVERAGAARVLVERESKGSDLASVLGSLMNRPDELERMRAKMADFHRPDAAIRIVDAMTARVYLDTKES